MNKLGIEQPDYYTKQQIVIQESSTSEEAINKYITSIDQDLNGEIKEKVTATRLIIILLFAVMPHFLLAAPLFQIFKALWVIGFIPGLLMFALCISASIGWYLFVSGFVWIPQSVLSSTLQTLFGLALFIGSWVMGYLMITGLIHGAKTVWNAITGTV